jgi:hypothetical protein
MRSLPSALVFIGATAAAHATAPPILYSSISPAEFESILEQHGAKVWRVRGEAREIVHVRLLDAEDFQVRYWGCEEARPPAWVCAYSIDKVYRNLHLKPAQANEINRGLALGRVYVLTSNQGSRKRGDAVLDHTVSLGKGVTRDYILGSFGEMLQGIEDHFESGLDRLPLHSE